MKHLFLTSASLIILSSLAFPSLAAAADRTYSYPLYDTQQKKPVPLTLLPRDRYGLFDWAEGVRMNIISPVPSLDGPKEEAPYDAPVIIRSKMAVMTDVLFPHDVHSYWLNCRTCHPGIFVQKRGGNKEMTMWNITEGEYCGRCHDRVAFPLRECYRCHLGLNVETTIK